METDELGSTVLSSLQARVALRRRGAPPDRLSLAKQKQRVQITNTQYAVRFASPAQAVTPASAAER